MPLLGDSKSVYVGTTPITKVMAAGVQVWPKGPPLPSLPACPVCKFWQPKFYGGYEDNAMLIPVYKGDKSERFQASPDGIDVEGMAVRYAVADDKPLYDGQWKTREDFPYRSSQDQGSTTYPQFSTYAEALAYQDSSYGNGYTALIDLKRTFTAEEISRLWIQVSYAKTGYAYNWQDVEYSAGNYEEGYLYIPYSQYRAYVGGFYVYRLGHYFETTSPCHEGAWKSPNTGNYPILEVDSAGIIRPTSGIYCVSYSPIKKEGTTIVKYVYRYQLTEAESFDITAPQQVFMFKLVPKDPTVSRRSDRALCDVPVT